MSMLTVCVRFSLPIPMPMPVLEVAVELFDMVLNSHVPSCYVVSFL